MTDSEKKEFTEHLEELRKRLLIVMYFFVGALIIGFFLSKPLIYQMQNAPWAESIQMHAFQVTDPLKIYLLVIVIIGLVVVLPVIMYQLWAFVAPGLYGNERKLTLSYIPIVMILMLIGMAFGYFVLVPYIIQFTFDLSEDMGIETTIGINQYFGFLFRTVLPFGVIFQMPIPGAFPDTAWPVDADVPQEEQKVCLFHPSGDCGAHCPARSDDAYHADDTNDCTIRNQHIHLKNRLSEAFEGRTEGNRRIFGFRLGRYSG